MADPIYYYNIIKAPVLTEKSHKLSSSGVVTLVVDKRYNKLIIKKAIESVIGGKVVSLRIINVKPKSIKFKGNRGTVGGYKKAIVTFDPSSKIDSNKIV